MKKIKSKNVQNYVMDDMAWKVDLPRFLKEIAECSKSVPYAASFRILAQVLKVLTERAIEINDPALNIIMLLTKERMIRTQVRLYLNYAS